MRSVFLGLLPAAAPVLAWGELGHETTGYIAQAFLGPKTLAFVNEYLDSSYDGQLGAAAPWADSVKYETAYKWSQPWHFIDAEDDPLGGNCSVVPSRDCGSTGCLLSAITNYTSRIQDASLADKQRDEALKFLTHFLGDITQPLHCENYEYGGNDIDVKYNGDSTELHAVWDTAMIETLLDASYSSSPTDWAAAIVTKIRNGTYESVKSSWVTCDSPSLGARRLREREEAELDPRKLAGEARGEMEAALLERSEYPGYLTCPVEWAQDSNSYDCSTVFTGYKASDLYPTYYNNNIGIVELQIAKAGYRLAAFLNLIFDGEAFPSGT